MEKVKCPYCGKESDFAICPRCFAEIPRKAEKSVKAEVAEKKPRKTNKEV